MTTRITIPYCYGQDAIQGRDLDIGTVIKWAKSGITLDCTDEQLAEMRSDCVYYSDPMGFDDYIKRTVCRSAKATLKRIDSPEWWHPE